MDEIRGRGWRRSWSFIAAATGATVGLGNIWKFSYLAGEHGGSVFVFAYLLCVMLVAVPVLIAEIVMGSRGRSNPIHATERLSVEAGASPAWQIIGWMGCLAGLLILSYYSVIAGWAMSYVEKMLSGEFTTASAQLAGDNFAELLASPIDLVTWHSIFVAIIFAVTAAGVRFGLGAMARLFVPLLMLALIALAIYSLQVGNAEAGLNFIFKPDWSLLTTETFLVALGQAFFSLSIGVGAMLAYGAYVPDKRSITGMATTVAVMDTLVSLLAGLAIFPLVFSFNMAPSMGPGLMFVALPYGFGNMIYGSYFGALFFVMVSMAAITSGVALMEPAIAWLKERFGWWRPLAALAVAVVIWALGLLTVFSFNLWQGVLILGMSPFSFLDFIASNVLLPMGGVAIALFVGWKMRRQVLRDELFVEGKKLFSLWYGLLRYIAVPGVLLIFASSLYDQLV